MNKLLLACAMILFIAQGLSAQHSISGQVIDISNNEPLPGAHVVIENTYEVSSTDQQGRFTLNKLQSGNYQLKISYLGFKSEFREVEISKDTTINFALKQSPIMEDEVIIRATRAQSKSPTTYTTVDKKEIQQINTGQDMPYLLQSTPSTVVTSDAGVGVGYTGIRIRGTDLTRINVTINGTPLNDSESQGVWWVDLPDLASSVDNIQIQRGVGSSTNGAAAFGASINIQSQKLNQKAYGEINSSYGSFNTYKNTLKAGTGLIKDKWAVDVGLSQIHSDGYIDRAFSDLFSFHASAGYYGKKTLVKLSIFQAVKKPTRHGMESLHISSIPTAPGTDSECTPIKMEISNSMITKPIITFKRITSFILCRKSTETGI